MFATIIALLIAWLVLGVAQAGLWFQVLERHDLPEDSTLCYLWVLGMTPLLVLLVLVAWDEDTGSNLRDLGQYLVTADRELLR